MANPLQIIVTTTTDRIIIDDVLEILILPHDGGMELRQNKDGWDLKPREVTSEKTVQMEQTQMPGKPGNAGGNDCGRRNNRFSFRLLGDGIKKEVQKWTK